MIHLWLIANYVKYTNKSLVWITRAPCGIQKIWREMELLVNKYLIFLANLLVLCTILWRGTCIVIKSVIHSYFKISLDSYCENTYLFSQILFQNDGEVGMYDMAINSPKIDLQDNGDRYVRTKTWWLTYKS